MCGVIGERGRGWFLALGNQHECWWGAGFGYEGIISLLSRRMEDYPKEGFSCVFGVVDFETMIRCALRRGSAARHSGTDVIALYVRS